MQVGRLKKLDSDFTEAAVATTELMHSPVRSEGAREKLYFSFRPLLSGLQMKGAANTEEGSSPLVNLSGKKLSGPK